MLSGFCYVTLIASRSSFFVCISFAQNIDVAVAAAIQSIFWFFFFLNIHVMLNYAENKNELELFGEKFAFTYR